MFSTVSTGDVYTPTCVFVCKPLTPPATHDTHYRCTNVQNNYIQLILVIAGLTCLVAQPWPQSHHIRSPGSEILSYNNMRKHFYFSPPPEKKSRDVRTNYVLIPNTSTSTEN